MSGMATAPERRQTPRVIARVSPELITAAKASHPELADADNSALIRVALALLAGFTLKAALENLSSKRGKAVKSLPDIST